MMQWKTGAIAIALGLVLASCGSATNHVRRRAAQQLSCPESAVRVERLAGGAYRVFACGHMVDYVCIVDGWGRATCVIEGRDTSTSGGSMPRTWTDEQIADLSRRLEAPLQACLPEAGASAEIEITVAPFGRVSPGDITGEGVDERGRDCLRRALHGVVIRGRVSVPRSFRARVETQASDTDASGIQTSGEATEPETSSHIAARTALSERASAILACTDGASIAVEARWSGDGHVFVSVRGSRAGTDVEGCVRAAVGDVVLDAPVSPGSVLQPIAP